MLRSSLFALLVGLGCSPGPSSFVIANVTIVDGTGGPAVAGSVRVAGSRIEAVGAVQSQNGERVVDGRGLVLSPGFIDTHSHHDRGLLEEPGALAAVSQGITTIVVGQDGGSHHPLAEFYEALTARPVAVNVASYSGHGTLRRIAMGDDFRRYASADEIEVMRDRLRDDLRAGALGLATGLEYDPGIYSGTEEVMVFARETAAAGGRYISHLRSEDRDLAAAVDEIIHIGADAGLPVQISHLKIAIRSRWGTAPALLRRLDSARAAGIAITADVYPYPFWQSTMTVLFPDRDFDNRATASFALTELTSPDGMLIARFDPDSTYVGRTLREVADLRGVDPTTAYMQLIAESQRAEREGRPGGESIIATSMDERDIADLIAWEHTNISSDGALAGRHPRGFGAFPRVVRIHVRETGQLSLERAVAKMTGRAAAHMGFPDRGRLQPGAAADLVLFDPDRLADRATPDAPHLTAEGVVSVWVNGVEVYRDGSVTGAYPGAIIRRASSSEHAEGVS